MAVKEGKRALPRTVPAVLAATRVLAVLEGRNRIPCGLTQIANEAGLYKGTCNDILHTLEAQGYVVRDRASRGYLLGPALVGLGAQAVSEPAHVQVALEHLVLVNQSASVGWHIVERAGEDQILVVGRLDAPSGFAVGARVGERFPLSFAQATGRAFIAWSDEAERGRLFERLGGEGFFREFGGDRERFEEDLAGVRSRGYALGRGFEYGLGEDAFAFLSAPVFDRSGRVALVAAMTPVGRQAEPDRLPGHAACLVATVRAISAAIGGRLPGDYPESE
jgi:DNA-binding IclR family transcriptional regulator